MQASGPAFTFHDRRRFFVKVALLAVTTVALIPILLSRHELAAKAYLWVLAFIHVAGLFIIAIGVKRNHLMPDKRGLVVRVIGIVVIVGLLYVASQGLTRDVESWIFWGSLFAIWALHTVGLAFLHIRGKRENAVCPFV